MEAIGGEKVVRLDVKRGPGYSRVPAAAAQAKLRAESFRVLIALGKYADSAGHCWPSLPRLARESRVIRRNLHRNFRDLSAARLLRINDDGSYTLIFNDLPERLSPEPERLSPDTRAKRTTHRTTHRTTQQLHALGKPRGARVNPNDELFDRFIGAYPSRGRHANPRKPAQAEFIELVRRGTDPEKLIAAATRYAGAVADLDERRYVAQAVTWLRQERYNDQGEAAPILRASRAGTAPGRSNEEWREIVGTYKAAGARLASWPAGCGLPPQHRASRVPPAIRREFGFVD